MESSLRRRYTAGERPPDWVCQGVLRPLNARAWQGRVSEERNEKRWKFLAYPLCRAKLQFDFPPQPEFQPAYQYLWPNGVRLFTDGGAQGEIIVEVGQLCRIRR